MNLGERSSTWRKKGGEEKVVPSKSNPDALQKKREGGAEEGDQTLFKHHGNLSISRVRSFVERSNIKDEEEKEEPSQQGVQWTS